MSPLLLALYSLQFVKMTLDKSNDFAAIKFVRARNDSCSAGRLQNLFVARDFIVKVR